MHERGRPPVEAASNQPVRRERLIAGCRVALAVLSFVAVWLDPLEPARFVAFTYSLLAAYAAAAAALAAWLWRARSPPGWIGAAVHGADLAVFSALIVATAGASSPFFVYLTFALVAATLRWQTTGTLVTGGIALFAFLVAPLAAARLEPAGGFELSRFLIRSIYLCVLVVLLVQLAAFERRLRGKVAMLAALPILPADDSHAVLEALLGHAARVLRASGTALAWEDAEEPWANLVSWSEAGGLDWRREAPGALEPLAPPGLADVAFFAARSARAEPTRLLTTAGGRAFPGDPAPPLLRRTTTFDVLLSVPLRGETTRGRFLALDPAEMTADELVVGAIVAQQLAVQLDRLAWFERFHREGLAEERVRLASDVHDGVVQSLAAAALRLETARQLLDEEHAAAASLIEATQELLVTEQRELREFLVDLSAEGALGAGGGSLERRLDLLRERLGRHWNLAVTIDARLGGTPLAGEVAHHAYQLAHEALVNASRHGGARTATVTVAAAGGELRVAVADDGSGFPFRGSYGFAELVAKKLGPVSLKRRVSALGGRLTVASSERGAQVEMWLPLPPGG